MPRKEVWRLKKILASLLASAFLMTGLAIATASAKVGDPHEMSTKTTHSKKATPKPNYLRFDFGKRHQTITRKLDKPKPKPNAFDSYMGKTNKPKPNTFNPFTFKHHKTMAKPKPKATRKP